MTQTLRRAIETAEDLPLWRDHFPDDSILPGIVQLRAAVDTALAAGPAETRLASVERLKFSRPIRPGDPVELVLDLDSAPPTTASFRIECDGTIASSGRLRFAEPEPPPDAALSHHEPLEDPPDIGEVLAHRGSMSWLARVVSHDPNRTCCEVDLDRTAQFFDAALVSPAFCALEWMAQCASAHDNYARRVRLDARSSPRVGYLLGTRRLGLFRLHVDTRVPVFVEAVCRWGGSTALAAFDCRVFDSTGAAIAEARVSCLSPTFEESR
jgi:predicted hotdog family 3-hydroxylacyl-ACP dehydratase